jgi:hypothetical protein
MRLVKIKGYGPSLGLKFLEPIEVTPTTRIALKAWFYHYECDETHTKLNCGGFNCIEIHCNVVDTCFQNYNETFEAPEEELLTVCSPETTNCQFTRLKKTIYKGKFNPEHLLFINVKDGVKKIRNIAIELKTNLGENNVFEKINSSIYLVIES